MPHPLISDAAKRMDAAVKHLKDELARINVGRASSALVSDVNVVVYGSSMPLQHVASITVPDPSTIVIQPHDKGTMADIERALSSPPASLNPVNDGSVLRVILPKPSEERRRELGKIVSEKAEEARIAVRTTRTDAHRQLKDLQKKSEITEDDFYMYDKELQKEVDRVNDEIENQAKSKQDDLLRI